MIYGTSSLYDFQFFSRLYWIPLHILILFIPLPCARCNFLLTKNLIGARVTRNFVLLVCNLFAIKMIARKEEVCVCELFIITHDRERYVNGIKKREMQSLLGV